jgi:hypothetical protein
MAIIYMIWGKNEEKEWPVTSYVDVRSTKRHFDKLKENRELEKNKYDPTGNKADEYFVIKSTSFMTFDGFKAYMQIDEFSRESISGEENAN